MSELQRVAVISPLVLVTLGGARLVSFHIWIWSLILLLPLTLLGIVWLQLHLNLLPALPGKIRSGRLCNLMACVAILALGLLPWYV